jgi:hypothetical protein
LEHKLAGINHLVNRIVSYPIPELEKEKKEIRVSQQTINDNSYQHVNMAKMVKDKLLKDKNNYISNMGEENVDNRKKWSSFSYIGK